MLLLLLACASPPAPDDPGAEEEAAAEEAAAEEAAAEEAAAVAAPVEEATFVGSAACRDCHAEQHAAWAGSDHAHAQGGPGDVRGDLSDPAVAALVAAHPVVGTLGHDPLQQLLVEGEGGRLQVLPLAWDTRPVAAGGQRWFDPSEGASSDDPADASHWAHPEQSWTHQCAACHVTGLARAYDVDADRWDLSWAEDGVGCEACHGPGSAHVATQAALAPVTARTCAPCHALATPLSANVSPQQDLDDGWRLAAAVPPAFAPDGSQQQEAFTWNSFQQSAKARAGVTCTHCHDGHGAALRKPAEALCRDCHPSPSPGSHAASDAGGDCVSCHMPATTFMAIDARPDHRFLVPSPAVDTLVHGDIDARLALAVDSAQPPGLRQAALAKCAPDMGPARLPAVAALLRDEAAPLRAEALALLDGAPKEVRITHAAPLLADPARVVRIQAAMLLVDADDAELGASAVARALAEDELKAFFRAGWDQAGTRVQRAEVRMRAHDLPGAEADYLAALARDPALPTAAGGLADLYRQQGRDTEAEALLVDAVARNPAHGRLRYALALCRVRLGRSDQAAADVRAAAALAPDDPEIQQALQIVERREGR
ncbi:MAG: tetratricopeptide repeat protein [Alphaproteobacteria bacterium]|nr:tetratricopeptide repeat protein [Alphaproteobacteria bacterium]